MAGLIGKETLRMLVTGGLLTAAFIIYQCPCDPLGECHLAEFYLCAGLPVLAIAFVNG